MALWSILDHIIFTTYFQVQVSVAIMPYGRSMT
jgi:ABC-type long-subunit fatty acid transport system fused permease/ATPase subunit